MASPALTGTPTAPTALSGTNTEQIATTAFVTNAVSSEGLVTSIEGLTGAVYLSELGVAILNSPNFIGVPTAPTATFGTNTSQLATTAFVEAAVSSGGAVTSVINLQGVITLSELVDGGLAPLESPSFTGLPTAPTAAFGNSTSQVASTAFTQSAIGTPVFNQRIATVSPVSCSANDCVIKIIIGASSIVNITI